MTHPARGSGARFAVGRAARKISGPAHADTVGTHSTPEASAQRACINGLKRSASLAPDGRRIPIGMRTEQTSSDHHSSVFLDFIKLPRAKPVAASSEMFSAWSACRTEKLPVRAFSGPSLWLFREREKEPRPGPL